MSESARNMFERLEELELKDVIDAQLKIQVDAPWPREAECLEDHGLKDAHSILDVGTGNGYFLSRLAERYPDKQFTGIEVSDQLVDIAEKNAKDKNLSNIAFIRATCPVRDLEGTYDFGLARLALYCSPEREEVLSWVHGLLHPGGRMAIIEMDMGMCFSEPQDARWDKLFKSLQKIDVSQHSDPFTGRKLPNLLLQAGFGDIRFEQKHWYSSIGMEPDEFLKYWMHDSLTVHKIMPEIFRKEDLDLFREYIEQISRTRMGTAIAPICAASGIV